MPAVKFPAFMKRYQLQLLGVATDDVLPGAVVDRAKRGYIPQGHLRDLLPSEPARFWETEQNQANIVYGRVERDIKLGGKSSLSEMGVQIGGGLERASSATLAITDILARTFVSTSGHASLFSLSPKVFALRQSDKTSWRLVNGKWIVLETYYASEVTVEFTTNGNIDLQADIAGKGGVTASGSGAVTWTGKRSFTITNNNAVPFAFRGWQV